MRIWKTKFKLIAVLKKGVKSVSIIVNNNEFSDV